MKNIILNSLATLFVLVFAGGWAGIIYYGTLQYEPEATYQRIFGAIALLGGGLIIWRIWV